MLQLRLVDNEEGVFISYASYGKKRIFSPLLSQIQPMEFSMKQFQQHPRHKRRIIGRLLVTTKKNLGSLDVGKVKP